MLTIQGEEQFYVSSAQLKYHLQFIELYTHFAHEDWHEEVINEECFGGSTEVVLEEEVGERDDHVLPWGVWHGKPQHLHATHHHHQRANTEHTHKAV